MSSARTSDRPAADHVAGRGLRDAARTLTDGLVTLMLAVLLFRTFQVEGYMISTGSMAPTLLGYHKRVVCPTCQYGFACGVHVGHAHGGDEHPEAAHSEEDRKPVYAVCPNCGQRGIEIAPVPRNQGDQLLVHKHAFLLRAPRRWEVIVFRNPARASQAYVKRVVGLPGELLQIRDGDLYINGEIQRKPLATQRAMRIPVYDHDCEPTADPEWQPRWNVEDPDGGWKSRTRGFAFDPPPARQRSHEASRRLADHSPEQATGRVSSAAYRAGTDGLESLETTALQPQPDDIAWVRYRHWLRSGGKHETSVQLAERPYHVDIPFGLINKVRIDSERRMLACRGVLTDAFRNELLGATTDPDFARAATCLSEQSHFGSITDVYGYNRTSAFYASSEVRDLALECQLELGDRQGEFHLEMTDGRHTADFVIDTEQQEYRLLIDGAKAPVRMAACHRELTGRSIGLEMSMTDRQVLIAVDGELVFQPWNYSEGDPESRPHIFPVRFGARDLNCRVESLKLFRDVYYTDGGGKNGVEEPFQLKSGEYFVLGDNSPVSLDSRSWSEGAVPAKLLVGKPFVVHLPSRPGKLKLGTRESYIRLPDFSRMRRIR